MKSVPLGSQNTDEFTASLPFSQHNRYIDVVQRAFLEAGATGVAFRRKGVATALIREAERLAKEHRCTHIGLSVGSTDNPDAKRLFEQALGNRKRSRCWQHTSAQLCNTRCFRSSAVRDRKAG